MKCGTRFAIGLIGTTTILLTAINLSNEKQTREEIYKRAERYAEKVYGDGRTAMTYEQRREWYNSMNLETNEVPSKRDLQRFIDRCIDEKVLSR